MQCMLYRSCKDPDDQSSCLLEFFSLIYYKNLDYSNSYGDLAHLSNYWIGVGFGHTSKYMVYVLNLHLWLQQTKSIPSSNHHILITTDLKMNAVKIIFTQNIEYRCWACLVQNVLMHIWSFSKYWRSK